jgi:hypothetical protein
MGDFARDRPLLDAFRESRSFDVLHYQVVGPDIVQRADVGMIQRGHGLGDRLRAAVGYLQR